MLFGDTNQCHPVESDKKYYDYSWDKNALIRYLCDGNTEQLPYIDATARYEMKMYEQLETFKRQV